MRKALSPRELGVAKRDLYRLAKAMREETDVRTFRRLQAVLMVGEEHDLATTAHLTGFSQRSLYRFVSRYLGARDVAALRDEGRSGRPRVAPEITDERIMGELRRVPSSLGYRTNVWTVELLAKHLSTRDKCLISPRTLRRRMHATGLRCKPPRSVYSEKEPHSAQKKGRLSGS